ncbi:MAG: Ig-like domain-containing protein [Acutalibacteraceae bacterium]
MKPSNEYTLAATICPSSATNKSMSITSDNTDVAAVFGLTVYSRAVGTATITVRTTDGSNKEARCSVTVTNEIPVSGITISPSQKTITEGNSTCVTPSVTPSNATNKCVTWSSDNTNVATVHPTGGVITGLREGTARIYATACDGSGVSGYCTVTVNPLVHVSSVSLSVDNWFLNVGESMYLSAIVYPENAYDKSVRWTSSNPDVATIGMYSGLITAKSGGTTVITVETVDGNYRDTCTINVDSTKTAIIRKDGSFFKVYFQDGTIWRSIGNDLTITDDIGLQEVENRSKRNAEQYFTVNQLAYLYFLDPIGVENYVKNDYFDYLGCNNVNLLRAKDSIFEKIYGVKPRLYIKLPDDEITYFDNNGNYSDDFRKSVYSDAELIFGSHSLYNALSIIDFSYDLILDLIGEIPYVSTILFGVNIIKILFFSGSVNGLYSGQINDLLKKYMEYSNPDKEVYSESDWNSAYKIFNWCQRTVDILYDLTDAFSIPNPGDLEIYKKVKNNEFKTIFEVNCCDKCSIEDIIKLIED